MSMGMGTERIWAWGMDDGDTETWGRVPKYCACYSVLSPTRTVCFLTLSWYGDGRVQLGVVLYGVRCTSSASGQRQDVGRAQP